MEIITGSTGAAHIQSADDGAFNAAIFGTGNYVLGIGEMFSASMADAKTVTILDGDLLMNGRHIRIRNAQHENLTIESGTSGYNRIDLIVVHYANASGVESAELKVIKGTATTGIPTAPAYTTGNILEDATAAEYPLYQVTLSGTATPTLTALFEVKYGLPGIFNQIYPVGATYISANSTDPGTLFGGTWMQIKDKFLLSAGDTYTAGNTGGSADAVVVEHNHTQVEHTHTYGYSNSQHSGSSSTVRECGTGGGTFDTSGAAPVINNTGVDGTGKNLPPYLVVYVWIRTA